MEYLCKNVALIKKVLFYANSKEFSELEPAIKILGNIISSSNDQIIDFLLSCDVLESYY